LGIDGLVDTRCPQIVQMATEKVEEIAAATAAEAKIEEVPAAHAEEEDVEEEEGTFWLIPSWTRLLKMPSWNTQRSTRSPTKATTVTDTTACTQNELLITVFCGGTAAKWSKTEKKARKALAGVGLKKVLGIQRVTLKKSKNVRLFLPHNPHRLAPPPPFSILPILNVRILLTNPRTGRYSSDYCGGLPHSVGCLTARALGNGDCQSTGKHSFHLKDKCTPDSNNNFSALFFSFPFKIFSR